MTFKFENPKAVSLEKITNALKENIFDDIPEFLIGAALTTDTPHKLEELIRGILREHQELLGVSALLALGHLVRRYGHLKEDTLSSIEICRSNPLLKGALSDFDDDYEIFGNPPSPIAR